MERVGDLFVFTAGPTFVGLYVIINGISAYRISPTFIVTFGRSQQVKRYVIEGLPYYYSPLHTKP